MPPAYREVDDCELSGTQTECLLECRDDAVVVVDVRFLQLHRRTVQAPLPGGGFAETAALRVAGREYLPWDEAAEREERVTVPVSVLLGGQAEVPFTAPGGVEAEDLAEPDGQLAGRLVRRWSAVSGLIRLSAERVAGPYRALRLRLRVDNQTEPDIPLRRRPDGLRFALIAAHSLISVPGGKFLSMTEPPEWAAAEVAACVNTGTWPVLAGPDECRELLLSSPVILYDHAEIAAESAGALFDSTEIDEILTLRTLTLTDEEKREARDTDPRAADLIDRLDHLPPEMLERMHGAIRYLRPVQGGPQAAGPLAGGGLAGGGLAGGGLAGAPAAGAPAEPAVAVRPLVGPGIGHVCLAGDRSRGYRGRAGRPGQPGPDVPGRAPGRRAGSFPHRPGGAGRGGAVRRGRERSPRPAARG